MRVALFDFIGELQAGRQTGQLSVTVKGSANLFKIFFREGAVYHISCGKLNDAACLDGFPGGEFAECFFVPRVTVNADASQVPPIDRIVNFFREQGAIVEFRQSAGIRPTGSAAAAAGTQSARSPQAGGPAQALTPGDAARILDGIKTALMRQIGPVGARIFSKTTEKWNVTAPGRSDFMALAELLKDEIDDPENRKQFIQEVGKHLS